MPSSSGDNRAINKSGGPDDQVPKKGDDKSKESSGLTQNSEEIDRQVNMSMNPSKPESSNHSFSSNNSGSQENEDDNKAGVQRH